MEIPVKKLTREPLNDFCSLVRNCFFCGKKTLYRYIGTDTTPVCPSCAKIHKLDILSPLD